MTQTTKHRLTPSGTVRGVIAATLASVSFGAMAADAKKAAPAVPLEDRIKACAACHGADGKGVQQFPDYPILAGQYQDYLVKALRDYKSGARKNAIMGAQAQDLSIAEIRALARHFSSQSGGPLHVIR